MPSKKAKGIRAKTRDLFKKKGSKVTVNTLLQEIPVGAKVDIKIDGSVHSGIPHKRFHGFTGTVVAKQGKAFLVALKKQGATVLVGPAHLKISAGDSKAKKVEEVAA